MLLTAGLLGAVIRDADARALAGFTTKLGRILDGAELLQRAVAVERSLAYKEKLIGELSARAGHDIRNPVAAARSLAQQLAAEPSSPFAEEHAVILTELDRVEREVRSLLRFARRDDVSLAVLDVHELAQTTLYDLRARFDAAHVTVTLRGDAGLTVLADREKMRHVLVNLLENACDALAESNAPKRIAVTVWGNDTAAGVRVSDNGPGVSPPTSSGGCSNRSSHRKRTAPVWGSPSSNERWKRMAAASKLVQ